MVACDDVTRQDVGEALTVILGALVASALNLLVVPALRRRWGKALVSRQFFEP